MVIYSEDSALMSNQFAQRLNNYDGDVGRELWPYNLNLAGIYHDLNGKTMYIESVDTSNTIPFTKDEIPNHPLTLASLVNSSTNLKKFISVYPHNEVLIRGIISQLDLSTVLEAVDGQLLYYHSHLVEETEQTLMYDFQEWLYNWKARYHLNGYTLTDELYAAASIGTMVASIPVTIMNMREERCHTDEAHNFHIKAYLAGYGRLDRHFDAFDRKQKMFLYRNLPYIIKHSGHEKTFRKIIDNLFKTSDVPLTGAVYNLIHAEETYGVESKFAKLPIGVERTGYESTVELSDYHDAEVAILENNWLVFMNQHLRSVLQCPLGMEPTKQLETTGLSSGTIEEYRYEDVVVNTLYNDAFTDRYSTTIVVSTTLSLTVQQACIVLLYLARLRVLIDALDTGSEVDFPDMVGEYIPSTITVSTIVVRDTVPDTIFDYLPHDGIYKSEVEKIGTLIPNQVIHSSPRTLGPYAKLLHTNLNVLSRMIRRTENPELRSAYTRAVMECVSIREITIPDGGTSYVQWLTLNDIDLGISNSIPTVDTINKLMLDILEKTSGSDFTTGEYASAKQHALVDTLLQLSSYGIQVGVSTTPDTPTPMDHTFLRIFPTSTNSDSHVTLLKGDYLSTVTGIVTDVDDWERSRFITVEDEFGTTVTCCQCVKTEHPDGSYFVTGLPFIYTT